MKEIKLTLNGSTISLEEGDTILQISTADPEEAQTTYKTLAKTMRKVVAGL